MSLQIEVVIERLRRFYGRLPTPPAEPFAFFVWEVLSAETAPARRDAAFAALKRIPALTPDAFWKAAPARLEAAVALAGPYRDRRLAAIRTAADRFRRQPRLAAVIRGPIRPARRALRAWPGLGQAGAERLLLFVNGVPVFPADLRVSRVVTRLGVVEGARDSRGHLARALRTALDRDRAQIAHAFLYLSHHATATCTEVSPHCHVCPLLTGCPYGQRQSVNSAKPLFV